MSLRIETFAHGRAAPLIPALSRLRQAVFRDWPYLYRGTAAEEEFAGQGLGLQLTHWCQRQITAAAPAETLLDAELGGAVPDHDGRGGRTQIAPADHPICRTGAEQGASLVLPPSATRRSSLTPEILGASRAPRAIFRARGVRQRG